MAFLIFIALRKIFVNCTHHHKTFLPFPHSSFPWLSPSCLFLMFQLLCHIHKEIFPAFKLDNVLLNSSTFPLYHLLLYFLIIPMRNFKDCFHLYTPNPQQNNSKSWALHTCLWMNDLVGWINVFNGSFIAYEINCRHSITSNKRRSIEIELFSPKKSIKAIINV